MVMAQIDVLSGAYDDAIDELESLLVLQSWYTTTYMEADPLLKPLRKLPRFKALMEKYALSPKA
jgi:hypothetical protein